MLPVPSHASHILKETIETINFLIELPSGSVSEVSRYGHPIYLYRTAENTIVVQCYHQDESFTRQIAQAAKSDGFTPLKVTRHGLHFHIKRSAS